MGRERHSEPRKMRPQFLVVCEGETEEAYIAFQRQRYRIPIKIVAKVAGGKVSQRLIDQYKSEMTSDASEITTFLMYDGDVPEVVHSLETCDGNMLISTPCIEIWFIAHNGEVPSNLLSSDSCVQKLRLMKGWESYKKGMLSLGQQDVLWENRQTAVKLMSAKSLTTVCYSSIYKLIDVLETFANI